MFLEEGVCYDKCILLAKFCQSLPCFILYSEAKLACYSRYLLTSYFCSPVSYNEKDIVYFGVSSRMPRASLIAQLVKGSTCIAEDPSSFPGSGRSPGGGKAYPLQCSRLENSMDCIVHGVAKNQTRLSDFHFPRMSCWSSQNYSTSVSTGQITVILNDLSWK